MRLSISLRRIFYGCRLRIDTFSSSLSVLPREIRERRKVTSFGCGDADYLESYDLAGTQFSRTKLTYAVPSSGIAGGDLTAELLQLRGGNENKLCQSLFLATDL